MADYFQRHKIHAKILIQDAKPRIAPIGGGDRMTFDAPHHGNITY
jgi:hypothetical protein